jgi:predicted dehydrogenase
MSAVAAVPEEARMKKFAWAVVGPGGVARKFADTVGGLADASLHQVYGRDAVRTDAFVAACRDRNGVPLRAAHSLVAILEDPLIEGIYVATPHAQHYEFVRRCLEAGKPVLCEKPLVPNLAQGTSLVELASRKNVFLMEALWTRFLPIYETVAAWLRSDAIGPVRAIQCSFCFRAPFDPASRHYNPALAGGALLDLGVYCIAMTRWVIQQATGSCPEPSSIDSIGTLADTGVDQRVSAMLAFPGGLSSQFVCGLDGSAPNSMTILGERGCITLPSGFWGATEARLERPGELALHEQSPFRISGFEYEIEEAQHCIRAGLVESPHMTHADSLAALRWMDEIRRQVGVRYPFE